MSYLCLELLLSLEWSPSSFLICKALKNLISPSFSGLLFFLTVYSLPKWRILVLLIDLVLFHIHFYLPQTLFPLLKSKVTIHPSLYLFSLRLLKMFLFGW